MKRVITLLALAMLSGAQADTLVLPDRSSSARPEALALAKKLLQSANFTQDDLGTPVTEVIDRFTALLAGPHIAVDLTDPLELEMPKNHPQIVRGYLSIPGEGGGYQVYAIDTSGRILQLSKASGLDYHALMQMISAYQPGKPTL